MEEKRKLLKSVTSEAFLAKMAENIRAGGGSNNESRTWGRKSVGSTSSSAEAIVGVVSKDLQSLIGDAALSEDEKHAKELEELRSKGIEQDEEAAIAKLKALSERPASAEPAEEWVVDADGKKTVKKSVFRI